MATGLPHWAVAAVQQGREEAGHPETAAVRACEDFVTNLPEMLHRIGSLVVLQDRNAVDAPWRQVFLKAEENAEPYPEEFTLLWPSGELVDEADTPKGVVRTADLVAEFGMYYSLPPVPKNTEVTPPPVPKNTEDKPLSDDEDGSEEDSAAHAIEDGAVVEYTFDGQAKAEPALVRTRAVDPLVPGNKALLLAQQPGVHELVRLDDLQELKLTEFEGSAIDHPAWLMRGCGGVANIAGTAYGQMAWPWSSTPNTYDAVLFSKVGYINGPQYLHHADRVLLDCDLKVPPPERFLQCIVKTKDKSQWRWTAVIFNLAEKKTIHVGLTNVNIITPRSTAPAAIKPAMRTSLMAFTISSPAYAQTQARTWQREALAEQRKKAAEDRRAEREATATAQKAAADQAAAEAAEAAEKTRKKEAAAEAREARKKAVAAQAAVEQAAAEQAAKPLPSATADTADMHLPAVVGGVQGLAELMQTVKGLVKTQAQMKAAMESKDSTIASLKQKLKQQGSSSLVDDESDEEDEEPATSLPSGYRLQSAGFSRGRVNVSVHSEKRARVALARVQAEHDACAREARVAREVTMAELKELSGYYN